ncbi:hypothetical protein [Deinococcus misasensis]|uniref:hypothetical protein n=1 Tax=Deinococcus misasensis TaxID=392413 RepID=UPI000558FC04|nr:hypothetical protein [Deinococcus misasensis]
MNEDLKAAIEQKHMDELSPLDHQNRLKPEWEARLEATNQALTAYGLEIVVNFYGEAQMCECGEEGALFQLPVGFLEDPESAFKICMAMVEVYRLGRSEGDARGYERGCTNTLRNIRHALGIHQ